MIRNLVKRLREADRKIGSLALIDVYGRVARLLLELARARSTASGWSRSACPSRTSPT